jgi:thioredoxin reductase
MTGLPDQTDVLIVGAGPAGLSAATVLAARGLGTLVLDREAEPGGIPRHCAHPPYGLREFRRLMTGPTYARSLVARAGAAGARILPGVTVTALSPGPEVSVTTDAGLHRIAARAVLLATGTRETPRPARLIGGTRPGGVLTTGALQGLVHLNHQRPFRAPLILGSELVAFSALLTCAHAGIGPVGMAEPGPRATARWPSALFPWLRRVPLWLNTDLVGIEGRSRVTAAILQGPQGLWRLPCDGILTTGRFTPEATLVRGSHLALDPATGGPEIDSDGRCSDPGFFAAGNLLRPVETAGHCWEEGRRVALSILRALDGGQPAPAAPRLTLHGPLAWALPQRPGAAAAHDRLTLRMARPARGRLILQADGAEIAARALSALPERRLHLPLPPPGATDIRVIFQEDA